MVGFYSVIAKLHILGIIAWFCEKDHNTCILSLDKHESRLNRWMAMVARDCIQVVCFPEWACIKTLLSPLCSLVFTLPCTSSRKVTIKSKYFVECSPDILGACVCQPLLNVLFCLDLFFFLFFVSNNIWFFQKLFTLLEPGPGSF